MVQNLRITVGRTWGFRNEQSACVTHDLTGYRRIVDDLKQGTSDQSSLDLPWPQYRSRLWTHLFNGSYWRTPSRTLVAALLPLRSAGPLSDVPSATPVVCETLWHPFAVSSLVHVELAPVVPWPDAAEASRWLHRALRAPLVATAPLQDGMPLDSLPGLPVKHTGGGTVEFRDAGRFILLSALYDEPPAGQDQPPAVQDSKLLAFGLASLFDDIPPENAVEPLKSSGGAVRVDGDRVGIVLPSNLPRSQDRIRCLHSNVATLLAYLQNLASLTTDPPTEATRWFRGRAGVILNHLYRRASLPETGGVYRSRVPQLWIDERQLSTFVNATAPHLPALP